MIITLHRAARAHAAAMVSKEMSWIDGASDVHRVAAMLLVEQSDVHYG